MKPKYLLLTLPRSGLCNKIIIWANALVWCHNNDAQLLVRRWFHLPLGTLLRSEYKTRNYHNYFISETVSLTTWLRFTLPCPIVTSIDTLLVKNKHYYKYKGEAYILDLPKLASFRELILDEFYNIITPNIKRKAASFTRPTLGIHIRKGDFVKIGFDIELSYYINVIKCILIHLNHKSQVMVFSDAHPAELKEVLALEHVEFFSSGNDLVDVLVMAKSKILVTSYESSYSYWAAFMSNEVVLHHPKAKTVKTRPDSVNTQKFEGKFPQNSAWPELLCSNLKALNKQNLRMS